MFTNYCCKANLCKYLNTELSFLLAHAVQQAAERNALLQRGQEKNNLMMLVHWVPLRSQTMIWWTFEFLRREPKRPFLHTSNRPWQSWSADFFQGAHLQPIFWTVVASRWKSGKDASPKISSEQVSPEKLYVNKGLHKVCELPTQSPNMEPSEGKHFYPIVHATALQHS